MISGTGEQAGLCNVNCPVELFSSLWETGVVSLPQRPGWTTFSPQSGSYPGMGDLLAGRRKQSILVVDDILMNAVLLKELLTGRGYQVTAVQNAAVAEAEIRR